MNWHIFLKYFPIYLFISTIFTALIWKSRLLLRRAPQWRNLDLKVLSIAVPLQFLLIIATFLLFMALERAAIALQEVADEPATHFLDYLKTERIFSGPIFSVFFGISGFIVLITIPFIFANKILRFSQLYSYRSSQDSLLILLQQDPITSFDQSLSGDDISNRIKILTKLSKFDWQPDGLVDNVLMSIIHGKLNNLVELGAVGQKLLIFTLSHLWWIRKDVRKQNSNINWPVHVAKILYSNWPKEECVLNSLLLYLKPEDAANLFKKHQDYILPYITKQLAELPIDEISKWSEAKKVLVKNRISIIYLLLEGNVFSWFTGLMHSDDEDLLVGAIRFFRVFPYIKDFWVYRKHKMKEWVHLKSKIQIVSKKDFRERVINEADITLKKLRTLEITGAR